MVLEKMQGHRASSGSKGDVSCFFSSCGGNLGYILEVRRGWAFNTSVCSATSGLLTSDEGHLRNVFEAWQANRDASRGEAGDRQSLSRCHSDIGIPINFQVE